MTPSLDDPLAMEPPPITPPCMAETTGMGPNSMISMASCQKREWRTPSNGSRSDDSLGGD